MVSEARSSFVILDTAPTGHTLLLMDATGAYHRQIERDTALAGAHFVTPLMHLQDPAWTRIILVTLAETTPVSEAAALQADLRRAHIEPFAWVVNRSMAATPTLDPLLTARSRAERAQIQRVREGVAHRIYVVPWLPQPPMGVAALRTLLQALPKKA